MADNISINFEELESSIETTVSDISGVQSEISSQKRINWCRRCQRLWDSLRKASGSRPESFRTWIRQARRICRTNNMQNQ